MMDLSSLMMDLISLIVGIIVGFTACILLWLWIEQRNAKRENESKK